MKRDCQSKKVILCCICICIITVFSSCISSKTTGRKDNGVKQLSFEVGDTLEGYNIYDSNDELLDISEISSKKRFIIFAWDLCGDCKAEYTNLSLLYKLYNSEELNIVFVWDNNIPYDTLNSLGILKSNNYTVKDKYKFTDWVPSYFIVDEDNTIILKSIELKDIVEYFSSEFDYNEEKMKDILYKDINLIGLDRCSGCVTAYNELRDKHIGSFQYIVMGEPSSIDIDQNVVVDKYGIISKALKLEELPQIITYKNDKINIQDARKFLDLK